MPEPIAWQIQENLKTALDNIDGTGSYVFNLSVDYEETDQNTWNALDALIGSGSITRNDSRNHQAKTDWDHEFEISVSVPVGAGASGESDQRLHQAFADVARAVMADPQRGNLAHDTMVLGYEPIDAGTSRLGLTVSVMVTYRTDELDLTSK